MKKFSIFNFQLSIFNKDHLLYNRSFLLPLRVKQLRLIYRLRGIGGCIVCCLLSLYTTAQKDTSKRQTIEITSTYKPVLRNAVKINLSASPLSADTSRPRLAYNIPAQNLFFSYQPITLKPLALEQDTGSQLGVRNYVKAGFGNFSTPYVAAALSFGDGKTSLVNLYGNYTSSRGKIENQDFSELKIKGTASLFSEKNETYGRAGINASEYFQYGYNHALPYVRDSLRRKYNDFFVSAGVRNIAANEVKINYNPSAEVHVFTRADKATESTLWIEAPVEKKFGESVAVRVSALANLNSLIKKSGSTDVRSTENLFQVAPELVYYSGRFTFHGGVTPSWNNNEVSILPNVYGEAQLQSNSLLIQAGWVGRYITTSFRSLAAYNPYISDPSALHNTKEVQLYGGLKGSISKHFSFNAKAAFITYNNVPLFQNNVFADGKSFLVSYETKMNDLLLHGDMSLVSQDKFTLTAALDLHTYTNLQDNLNAWGLIPVQLTGSFRWNAFKQVLFKADVFAFSGVPALTNNNTEVKLKGTDLSAGAEFKITEKFSAWLDVNNLLNQKYERWNNYPVYGLNYLGGLIVRF